MHVLPFQPKYAFFRPDQPTVSTSTPTSISQILADVPRNDEPVQLSRPKGGPSIRQKRHKSKFAGKFSILGNNSASLKAKKDSLKSIIKMLKFPSSITLQKTKLAKNAVFSLDKYQIQKNRSGMGGGLLTAIDPILNPMLISTRNEEAEILTVQIGSMPV
jgi:hypothetical protein